MKGVWAGTCSFYTDYGLHGCCACPWQTNPGPTHSFGDAGYIKQDMLQLARQGVDYVKVRYHSSSHCVLHRRLRGGELGCFVFY